MINFNPAYSNINFKSYRHEIINKSGEIINRGDTCLYRWDLNFNELIKFLETKYKDVNKVNILAHACSDGEEIFSFLAKLIDMVGEENAKKYLPIEAKDIEEEHIRLAKKGKYEIKSFERDAVRFYLGRNFYNYFEYLSSDTIRALSNLRQNVIFSKSDIMVDIKKQNFDNTVMFARNFWHYLNYDNVDKLGKTLSKEMNKSSTLIIGSFDKEHGIDKYLCRQGFEETMENVFEIYK